MKSSSSWSTARRRRAPEGSASSASARGSLAPDTRTRRSSSSGRSPGRSSRRPPALAARQHAVGEGREETGAQDRRLAAARRADDAEEAGADEACDELGHEPLAAEEVVGIDRLEARKTLERADALGRHDGSAWRARERARLLAREPAGRSPCRPARPRPRSGRFGRRQRERRRRRAGGSPRRPRPRCAARASSPAGREPLIRAPSPARVRSLRRGPAAIPAAARSVPVPPLRGVRTRPRARSHAETAAVRRDTRRARSRASRRPPDRRSPRRRSAPGRRSRWCRAGGRRRRWPVSSETPLRDAEVRQVDVVGAVGPGAGSSSTLEGFTSRWTRPRAWAASRALATWATMADRVRGIQSAELEALFQVGPST